MTEGPVVLDEERDAMVKRAMEVWAMYCDIWLLDMLSSTQRAGVMNMLFEMQRREHKHFGIELPAYPPPEEAK